MKATQYAEALYIASRNKSEEEVLRIVTQTISLLKEKGHERLLGKVLLELEKIQKRRGGIDELLVRVAKDTDAEAFMNDIQRDAEVLGAASLPRKIVTDDTLIGGYELRAKGSRIDRTYKRSLLTLYNNLITN